MAMGYLLSSPTRNLKTFWSILKCPSQKLREVQFLFCLLLNAKQYPRLEKKCHPWNHPWQVDFVLFILMGKSPSKSSANKKYTYTYLPRANQIWDLFKPSVIPRDSGAAMILFFGRHNIFGKKFTTRVGECFPTH